MMSSTAPTTGYGPLEVFFDAEEGVSFKADNGHFLCPKIQKEDGIIFTSRPIEAMINKEHSSKFFVEKLDNGKVRLKDRSDYYLRRIERHGRPRIESRQMTPDASCEFLVCTRNGKVIFQGDNGLFLSRIYWTGPDEHTLESVKTDADVFCEFVPDIGDLIRPAFEIVSIECFSPKRKRTTVREKEFVNKSSLAELYTFKLTWQKKVTEVTTWNRAWGLNTAISADTDCFGSSLVVTLWYDGVHGKSCSKEKIISEAEEVSVTVPPGKTMTAKLVVNMDEHSEIPFTARIKKTKANGEIEMLTEDGTWKGVVYDIVGVEIEENNY